MFLSVIRASTKKNYNKKFKIYKGFPTPFSPFEREAKAFSNRAEHFGMEML